MASTSSPNLKLELIATGEQQGTWGSTTNTNLGTLLEEAIGGYAALAMADSDQTLTMTPYVAATARNMTIEFTGALTAARTVSLSAALKKIYIVKNATTGGFAVTFKVTGQTGVSIPSGSTAVLYVDGTDARLVSQSPVPVTLGGTGVTTSTGSGSVVLSTSPTLTTPNLGTPSTANLTNATDLPIVAGTTGTLSVARGGTGVTTSTGTGSVVLSASPTLTGTPTLPTGTIATTQTADTNSTQIATTAYVIGQGYLKSATAASTYQTALGFNPIQQGGGTSQFTNKIYIGWSASNQLRAQVDTTDFGTTWPINISGTAAAADTGGFTLLGTLNTTSGPTQTAFLTLTGYRQLYITYGGVSATGNGTLLCSSVVVSPASTNADTLTGVVEIDLNTGFGSALGRNAGAVQSYTGNFGITAASTSITFGWSAAVSFDAGTITFYGVK